MNKVINNYFKNLYKFWTINSVTDLLIIIRNIIGGFILSFLVYYIWLHIARRDNNEFTLDKIFNKIFNNKIKENFRFFNMFFNRTRVKTTYNIPDRCSIRTPYIRNDSRCRQMHKDQN